MNKQWIYILSQSISQEISVTVMKKVDSFLQTWESHGSPIQANSYLLLDQIVVIVANEEDSTSGCSIDSLRREVSKLLSEHGVEIISSNVIPLLSASEVILLNRKDAKSFISSLSDKSSYRVIDYNLKFNEAEGIQSISVALQNSWLVH